MFRGLWMAAALAVAFASTGASAQKYYVRSAIPEAKAAAAATPTPTTSCTALKTQSFPTGSGVVYLVKKKTTAEAQAICESAAKARGAGVCGWDNVYDGGQVYWWPAGSKINTRSETGLWSATCS